MAATVSWDGLRELAGFRAEKGCAISLYVDLDPTVAPTAGDAATRINSLVHEGAERAEAAHELTHEQREALRADLDRIRAFFAAGFDRDGSRGVAVFSAGLDNVWRTLRLADPVADRIAIARWREEAGRNGRAAAGWGATLEAASDGRVELLLFQDGTDRSAWQCRQCGRVSAAGGACPLDGSSDRGLIPLGEACRAEMLHYP